MNSTYLCHRFQKNTQQQTSLPERKLQALQPKKTFQLFLRVNTHVSTATFHILNHGEVSKHNFDPFGVRLYLKSPLPKLDASKNPFGLLMKGQKPLETLQGFLCGCIVQQRPLRYRQSVGIQKGKSLHQATRAHCDEHIGIFMGLIQKTLKTQEDLAVHPHQNLGRVALRF